MFLVPETMVFFSEKMEIYGKRWENMKSYGRIWDQMGEYGTIWENMDRLGIWETAGTSSGKGGFKWERHLQNEARPE